jgi:hypothetical protein
VALYKDLRTDRIVAVDRRSTELVERAVVTGAGQYGDDFELVTAESREADPPTGKGQPTR